MLSVQLERAVPRAVLLVIGPSGMSSHWRLITSKRRFDSCLRFVPVRTFCTAFKAARRAARAAATARTPPLPLALPLRRRQRRSAGAKGKDPGPAISRSLGAAADLTREPSRWPRSG